MNVTDNTMYTLKEVAEILGVSKRTVRRYIQEGYLTAFRVGDRIIKISEEDLNNIFKPMRSEEESRVLAVVDEVISSLD